MWWHSDNAGEGGTLALNFGRIQNDELDEQLGIIRTSSDEEERQASLPRRSADLRRPGVQHLERLDHLGHPFANNVHGVTTPIQLPDDGESAIHGLGFTGRVNTMQLWVDGGPARARRSTEGAPAWRTSGSGCSS